MPDEQDLPLSVNEIAALLGVSHDKARQWCRDGKIASWYTGDGKNQSWKASRSDAVAFRESRRAQAAPARAAAPKTRHILSFQSRFFRPEKLMAIQRAYDQHRSEVR